MPLQQINVSPLGDYPNPQDYYQQHGGGNVAKRCDSAASSMSSATSGSGGDMCRICHCEGDSEAPLIAPCYCAGSLRYVHQQCLQQWIKSSNIRSCELCKFQFIMQTKVKPFSEWEHLEMSGFERRKLFCAVMFHAVALTCVVWSLYVLIDRTADEIQNGLLEWPFWTKLVVVAIGFTGGVVFMYIQCKAYLQICQRWKAFNRVIYVQNAPEKPSMTPSRSSDGVGGGGEPTCVAQSSNAAAGAAYAHAPPPCFQPPNSQFKTYRDGLRDREDNEETSIDLKGVRNLHIFFNDEKRIQVQKDKASDTADGAETSGGGECCHGNGNNGNGQPIGGALIPGCSGDSHNTGTSWHIKIGKSGGETSDDYQDTMKDDEVARPANGGDLESPVLKLQIKKAEIVIKFGQKSTSSPSNNSHNNGGGMSNGTAPGICVSTTPGNNEMVAPDKNYDDEATHCYGNNESSVNIEIDSLEKHGDDPIVIDLVHQNNRYQFPSSQNPDAEPVDVVTSQASSSNPVQITLDFGRKDSDNRSLPPEDVRLLPASSDLLQTPVDDYPVPKSEPGSGSQSPLLAVRSIN